MNTDRDIHILVRKRQQDRQSNNSSHGRVVKDFIETGFVKETGDRTLSNSKHEGGLIWISSNISVVCGAKTTPSDKSKIINARSTSGAKTTLSDKPIVINAKSTSVAKTTPSDKSIVIKCEIY